MSFFVDPDTIEYLWTAINVEPPETKLSKTQSIFKEISKDGWVLNYQIEDILYLLDRRLVDYEFDLKEFSETLGLKWETVYRRPKPNSLEVSGSEALRVEEAALFFIILERMGFNSDATSLVEQLLPAVKSRQKKYLTQAELAIFWFKRVRHRSDALHFLINGSEKTWPYNEVAKRIKTRKGYEITLEINENGDHAGLRIDAPKYRKARKIVKIICQVCGLEWSKGDPDSSSFHRKEHKNRIVYMDPKPNEIFLQTRQQETEPELVTIKSPAWKHNEMYIRALAFKREFHYDFVQWNSPTEIGDRDARGFLITNDEGAILGAYSFRKRSKGEDGNRWALQWVWICPKHRRFGHFAKRWKELRKRFGDFHVEPPVSDAMKSFLKKQGDLCLLEA